MDHKNFTDTKLTLKFGEKTVPLRFGIYTRRRIEEQRPGFNILGGDLPDFEIIPFLIQCAVEPEDQIWKTEKEFFELYEECTDEEGLANVLLAYQNAMGFTNQRFSPLLSRYSEMLSVQDEKGKTKKR
jgi:hypothetical protein